MKYSTLKYSILAMMFLVFLFACNDAPPKPAETIIDDMNFTQFSVDCGNVIINVHIKSGYTYSGGESDSDNYTERVCSITKNFMLNDSNITKSGDKSTIEWFSSQGESNPISSNNTGKQGKLKFSNDYSKLDTVSLSFFWSSSSRHKPVTSNGSGKESFVLINVPFTYENDELVIDLGGKELYEMLIDAKLESSFSTSNYFEGSSSYNRKKTVGIVNIPDSAFVRIRCY